MRTPNVAQHAITTIHTADHTNRAAIERRLRKYVGQLDGTALPVSYDQPITGHHHNLIDAWRMLGRSLAHTLGITTSATEFPDTARAILAGLDASATRLTALATATRQPAVVALAHVAGVIAAPAHRASRADNLGQQLHAIADHLTRHRPDAPMTEAARMTLALHTAGTAQAARPLLAALPWPNAGITRGEYAQRVTTSGGTGVA